MLEIATRIRHRVKRCVGFMHPEIDEKWLLMAVTLFDEGDGAVGVFMNRDLLLSTIESTKLIVSVFARQVNQESCHWPDATCRSERSYPAC